MRIKGNRFVWKISIISQKSHELLNEWKWEYSVPNLLLAHLLTERGITTYSAAQKYLNPDLNQLYPPELLPDVERAVDLFIKHAVKARKPVFVVGDYDVDGTTSVSMLKIFFDKIDVKYHIYIPDRFREGYGLSMRAIEEAIRNEFELAILVDIGTRDFATISLARSSGMDIIVLDHHDPETTTHPATAFVNPKRSDSTYPFKGLSGAGVVLKFLQLLARKLKVNLPREIYELVTLSICADVVPVVEENRILVNHGLRLLQNPSNPGIKVLMQVSGLLADSNESTRNVSTYEIAFILAPRLNAAGRMRHAREALYLLSARDYQEAFYWANQLNMLNYRRQSVNRHIDEEIKSMMAPEYTDTNVLVFAGHGWNRGAVGINASRLVDELFKPVILLAIEDELAVGSGRSIPGINILRLVEECSHLLYEYGGHEQAVGLKLPASNIEKFRKAINEAFKEIYGKLPERELKIDAAVPLAWLTPETAKAIEKLGPFGYGNERPVFVTPEVREFGHSRKLKDKHLLLRVSDRWGGIRSIMGFTYGNYLSMLQNKTMDVCYRVLIKPKRKIPDFRLIDWRVR